MENPFGSYGEPGTVNGNIASSLALAMQRTREMPSDSEYALKRLVENEGLSIEDAVARMKACQHPNEYDEDSPFTGNTWYVCPDCGFTFCWEYVSLEMPYNLRARAQERWPEEVDAVVAAYQAENQGVAPEPPS